MIGFLSGTVLQLSNPVLLLTTSGVGYEVWTSATTAARLNLQQAAQLYIYTHVREDALELFGFTTMADKQIFQLLLTVSGVGPKSALHLSSLGSSAIIAAVQQADISVFTTVPRVGKKLAQKIIIELKSKLGSLQELELGPELPQVTELKAALQALGFSDQDIHLTLTQFEITDQSSTSELLKQALQKLGQK